MSHTLPEAALSVRELRGASEAIQVEELQLATWGRHERDVVPRGILVALQLQGGLLAGAFHGTEMIGFVLGFPTRDPAVQHSHMLAVTPGQRKSGAALALKSFQRTWCLERGITRVVWTFDPLRGLNANFNLCKLGAVIRHYYPDLYGPMSGINAGVPSDRVLAEWELRSASVESALSGQLPVVNAQELPLINPAAPTAFMTHLSAPRLGFQIPPDYGELLTQELALAQEWRRHGRDALQCYFAAGYAIRGFCRTPRNLYVLEREVPPTPAS
ncbi:GNAT family N-acetyltransferase [Deinococcus peraridilitoris]|uniref:N-acetyltransferase domain-containing protein n=1 Tax=Deinococcus peraridilitoris (strain DSM 19664 / LMG 22246 / CIP 109416 / KR-200) TaxID=937777 RepID=L0A7M7_DEIPD|nr:GNAT family N-acetyltransferase [Deinococcus peraridilitoris]AFZ69060.1 hypothetical protein Deipe_3634 [Deinococcus peraridilitoris DSM 19664]